MATSPPRRRDLAADLTLVAAGPVLWGTHLLAAYALVPWACRRGGAGVALMAALAIVATAAAAFAAATAVHRRPRRTRLLAWSSAAGAHTPAEPVDPEDPRGRNRHVVAFSLAAGFGFAAVLHVLVAILVDPCA